MIFVVLAYQKKKKNQINIYNEKEPRHFIKMGWYFSECGQTQINMYDQNSWQNYCGHCGAKMTAITTKGSK